MATLHDDPPGVPFAIGHAQRHFRLLELPPELVALLDGPHPPRLSLKSQAPSAAAGAPNPTAAYAVLCTANTTYQVRQVQTSNSLLVTLPAMEAHGNDGSNAEALAVPTTRAVAACTATLELQRSDESPAPLLEQVLPLYDLVDGEVDAAGNGRSQAAIFSDLPFSDGQCAQAWTTVMAFEFAGSSFRPSAGTLSQIWRSVLAAAVAEGLKLDEQFLADDLARAVSEEGHPAELVVAIVRRLATDDQDTHGAWACLDRTKTVHFVGKTLLEAKEGPDYLTAEFIDTWKDSLPEQWREDAELNTISGAFELPSSTTVRFKGPAIAAKAEIATSKAATSSRKWHEKFGRARQR